MKKLAWVVAALVLAPHFASAPAVRAAEDEEKERRFENVQTRQRHAVGQKCAKVLEGIQTMVEAQQWQAARTALEGAFAACTTSYEKSQVYNFLGYVYYSLERYRDAIGAYQKMIAEPDVDERQAINTRYTIAQLYLVIEDYASAARELEAWMRISPIVGPDAKVLLAQAYYQLDRKRDSLRLVEEAIAEVEAKGQLPKEGWWSLQRVLYYERGDYAKVVEILKKLIKHYPSFSYWRQLGGMYAELNRELDQLVVTDAVYLAGKLETDKQLLSLAYLYLGANAPYMAARIIEKGMREGTIPRNGENLELLGLAWQQAQDAKRALPILEEAAKLSSKGTIYARLAGVYLDLDRNREAVVAARNAIRRGGVRRVDITYMNLGNALLNLHCYDQAIEAFRKAAEDKRSARYANQWIDYAKREGERRRKLIEAGAKISACQLA
ncbi:MAG: hypothetical protein KatS3mg124_1922 [Porticoccaceae bacterium]|nr:MAG: hypothetical protein KatS3mg124_1922 [Porticoccaceae bacterium]